MESGAALRASRISAFLSIKYWSTGAIFEYLSDCAAAFGTRKPMLITSTIIVPPLAMILIILLLIIFSSGSSDQLGAVISSAAELPVFRAILRSRETCFWFCWT